MVDRRGRKKVSLEDASARTIRKRQAEFAAQGEGVPVKPKAFTLKTEAGKLWASVVPQLIKTGLATALDTSELVAMCEFWQDYRTLRAAGESAKAQRAYEIYAKCSKRFGLTPYDRNRIAVGKGNDKTKAPEHETMISKRLNSLDFDFGN